MARTPAQVDTGKDMRAIVSELSGQVFERRRQIEAIAITLLAGKNAILLGDPGSGKSMLIKLFAERFVGAEYFEALLDKQLGKEELFGQIDLPLYENKGVWERDTEGMLPSVHLAFLDEIGKAGPAVLNTLLKILNEREYKHGKTLIKVPMISVFGASNELLEDELQAFWDRFLIRMWVHYVKEPSSFVALLQSAVVRPATTKPTTIQLSHLLDAVTNQVPRVTMPDDVAQNIATLWGQVKQQGIEVSDRRWRESVRLLQASAYLNGRSEIDGDDLLVWRDVLWNKPEECETINNLVSAFASEMVKTCIAIETQIDEMSSELKKLSAPGLQRANLMKYSIEVRGKIAEAHEQVVEMKKKALSGNKETARIDQVAKELIAMEISVLVSTMNMDDDRATATVNGSWSDWMAL